MRRIVAPLAALLVALTLALPTGGLPMAHAATTQTLTNTALPAGTTTFPAAPAGWNLPTSGQMTASVDATSAPAGTAITIAVQRNAGSGWGDWVSYNIFGGPHTNKSGGQTWDLGTDWQSGNMRVLVTTSAACTIASITITTP